MLNFILQTRAKLLGQPHIATGEAKYTLGLLYLFMENKPAAHECISAACDIYTKHLGPEHPSTRDVIEVLQHLNKETSLFPGADSMEATAPQRHKARTGTIRLMSSAIISPRKCPELQRRVRYRCRQRNEKRSRTDDGCREPIMGVDAPP